MTADGPVQIRLFVEARPTEETVEIPRETWAAMTPRQRAECLDDMVAQAIADAGGAGYQILGSDSGADQVDQ